MTDSVLASGLYVCATPIGNLRDASPRLGAALMGADLIACEDSRVTRSLLGLLDITTNATLISYHDHNAEQQRPRLVAALQQGQRVALVSDAGTPLIADPGFKLVREARAAGVPVFAVPGPSAAIAALSIAGLPTDAFSFQGFLPAKEGARRERLALLFDREETVVVYEASHRVAKLLREISEVWGHADIVVARELTKKFEEVRVAPAATLADQFAETAKGEFVIVLPPGEKAALTDAALLTLMAEACETQPVKAASRTVAEETGVSARTIYQLWIHRDD